MSKPSLPPPPNLSEAELAEAVHALLLAVATTLGAHFITDPGLNDEDERATAASVDALNTVANFLPDDHPSRKWLLRRARNID